MTPTPTMKIFPFSLFWPRCAFVLALLMASFVARAQDATPAATTTNSATPAAPPAPAPAALPTLFVCGDSTAKNGATAKSGQVEVGWGTTIPAYFDPTKVTVNNAGHAGTSSHTYYDNAGDWKRVLPLIKPGDYVLEVFGINDGSTPNGLGDEVNAQGVHTYGWYMAEMATEAQARGARVYLLTVTARNIWTNPHAKYDPANDFAVLSKEDGWDPKDDQIERGTGKGVYTQWTKDVGKNLNIPVLDLTNLEADKYEKIGRETVNTYYADHNHTYAVAADLIASYIVSGLKAIANSPFTAMLSEKGQAIETADKKYVEDNPITNSPTLYGQIPGAVPHNPALSTIWLIGDSTVRNGSLGNGSGNQWGWGGPIEYYFDRSKINVVNRALGGTSSRSFYNSDWRGVLANVKKGDFVIMQFGHNDQNGDFSSRPNLSTLNGIGDETKELPNAQSGHPEVAHTFGWYMKQFIEDARAKGATPIVCSLIPRKIWDGDKIVRHNADYFDYAGWAGQAAAAEKAPFVDLMEISARKYDALGQAKVEPLFGDPHTHTEWYGAVINAESVIGGLKALKDDPLAPYLSEKSNAVPAADFSKPALEGGSTVESAASAAAAAKPAAAAPAASATSAATTAAAAATAN